MIEFYQDTCACYLDHATARARASILLPSSSVLPNLRMNRRAISDWKRPRRRRGASMLSAVVVAATVACNSGQLSAALAESGAAGDMAVTVTRTTNVCFSDTLQVTGVVLPRNEILVRPDREGLQISQVLAEPGDTVVSGQVLARLTPPEGQPGGGTTAAVQAPAAGVMSRDPRLLERRHRPGPSPCSESRPRERWNCWPKHRSNHSPASPPIRRRKSTSSASANCRERYGSCRPRSILQRNSARFVFSSAAIRGCV